MTKPHTRAAWDDDDNRPVIPKIPHPRPSQHAAAISTTRTAVAR